MPIDGIVVSNLVYELKENLLGGRIDKISQPEKDEIILSIKTPSLVHKLLITANPNYPRLHITQFSKENPQSPPMFCMLLRKYLSNGRITDIYQPSLERIIEIHIQAPNQVGDMTLYKLIVEIMGKHSNIILVDENYVILDSIKHITHEISSVREVLPGGKYVAPPNEKTNPLEENFEVFKSAFANLSSDSLIPKLLLNRYTGFSKLISNEIYYRYSILNSSQQKVDTNGLWEQFNFVTDTVKNKKYSPSLYIDSDDKPYDFSCIPILQYRDYKEEVFDSISLAIESFYEEKDKKERLKQKSDEMKKHIEVLLNRCSKKLERLQEKIADSNDREKYKIWGDLILSNIHSINKGDEAFSTINYYSDAQENVQIPLDDQLTPAQNAQKYYKMYNKLKTAYQTSLDLSNEALNEIDYLESILSNIENCSSEADIEQIRQELSSQGYVKSTKSSKKKVQIASKPQHFISSDGFDIYVGKNNIQNDELTLKFAQKTDLWLHTKAIHGTHVIVKTDGKEVPDNTLVEAATLAAYYSKGKASSKVEVDYTAVKNVKKPSGAKPGMVIYVDYKTIIVEPNEKIVNNLKKS